VPAMAEDCSPWQLVGAATGTTKRRCATTPNGPSVEGKKPLQSGVTSSRGKTPPGPPRGVPWPCQQRAAVRREGRATSKAGKREREARATAAGWLSAGDGMRERREVGK